MSKEECQAALRQLGAEEQKNITDVWHFAGHWFKIMPIDEGKRIFEIVEL